MWRIHLKKSSVNDTGAEYLFSFADRNRKSFVNISEQKENDFQKATIKLYHDAANASSILLPVMK